MKHIQRWVFTGIMLPVMVLGADRPNIVLCMADDQGYGDMGYYGHPHLQTPNFDDLAASGLRFDRFYAAAPVCSPTRGSVMTGRHPNRFACFKWGRTLRPQEVTVAEALKKAGYTTGHFGKWHLGSVVARSPVSPGNSGFDRWLSAPNYYDNDPILSRNGVAEKVPGESSVLAAEAALDFMKDAVKAHKPFLAVVWFGSPHAPHQARGQDRSPYRDQPEKLQHFYGEITGMDRAVGQLRQGLDELGVKDNTLFWYCSDNGALPKLGNTRGLRGHKGSIYEGGLRVPAVIEWPVRIPEARVTETVAVTSDIFPTLLDLLGLATADARPLDGISLRGVIEGASDQRPDPVGFWQFEAGGVRTPSKEWMPVMLAAQQAGKEADLPPEQVLMDAGAISTSYDASTHLTGHAAWLDGDWKLHRITGKDGKVRYELYQLADDPGEKQDLAGQHPDRVRTMSTALDRWMRSVIDSLNGEDYPH